MDKLFEKIKSSLRNYKFDRNKSGIFKDFCHFYSMKCKSLIDYGKIEELEDVFHQGKIIKKFIRGIDFKDREVDAYYLGLFVGIHNFYEQFAVDIENRRPHNKNKICRDIKFGSCECVYNIYLPYKVGKNKDEWKCVSIDKCLLHEITNIWEQGIKTTGCCCGHGDFSKAFISVTDESIQKMHSLGYVKYELENHEDMFIPKTKICYKE